MIGRTLARPFGADWVSCAGQSVSFTARSLLTIGGPRAQEFHYFSALINGTGALAGVTPEFLTRSNYYFNSGLAMHTVARAAPPGATSSQLPSWMSSAFTSSTRTSRSETTNNENLKVHHYCAALSMLPHPLTIEPRS